jgi:SAM-dependent methyltransferase
VKHPLEVANFYHAYQVAGGFFGARVKAFKAHVDFTNVRRLFDIGCGPGHIVPYIPLGIEYIGFDTDARYIDYANRQFGSRAHFVSQPFDGSAAQKFGRPDLILMNGVLHHLDDATARAVLSAAAAALPDTGAFFALDGCYQDRQHPVAKYLIDHDRGKFVRTADGYQKLCSEAFPQTDVIVREDLSWVPYTFAITRGRKQPTAGVPGQV